MTCMSATVRSQCGLGYPPAAYTQNPNESMNSVLKRITNHQKQSIVDFTASLYDYIQQQQSEAKDAIANHSKFSLADGYKFLGYEESVFYKKTADQKERAIRRFYSQSLVEVELQSFSLADEQAPADAMTVKPSECGIIAVPYPIVVSIFAEAKAIMDAGVIKSTTSRNVYQLNVGKSNDTKVEVYSVSPSMCVCNAPACARWKAYRICSHTIAVSEVSGFLRKYIDEYNRHKKSVNLSALSNHGLPSKRGQKAVKQTSIRRGSSVKRPKIESYAATQPAAASTSQQGSIDNLSILSIIIATNLTFYMILASSSLRVPAQTVPKIIVVSKSSVAGTSTNPTYGVLVDQLQGKS